ncbi:hypothetical protein CPB83DRAFT_255399 [Crepidotus variabilis]|uniref:Uncharacterized protein n=1 Tax=Crepidotus variabilis TaxID=179855 RepID=A0A9P6JHL9_9AGAR|nr:hypothetical protein CPB83DRAFT_255399 [Crepidotus variabilis]
MTVYPVTKSSRPTKAQRFGPLALGMHFHYLVLYPEKQIGLFAYSLRSSALYVSSCLFETGAVRQPTDWIPPQTVHPTLCAGHKQLIRSLGTLHHGMVSTATTAPIHHISHRQVSRWPISMPCKQAGRLKYHLRSSRHLPHISTGLTSSDAF